MWFSHPFLNFIHCLLVIFSSELSHACWWCSKMISDTKLEVSEVRTSSFKGASEPSNPLFKAIAMMAHSLCRLTTFKSVWVLASGMASKIQEVRTDGSSKKLWAINRYGIEMITHDMKIKTKRDKLTNLQRFAPTRLPQQEKNLTGCPKRLMLMKLCSWKARRCSLSILFMHWFEPTMHERKKRFFQPFTFGLATCLWSVLPNALCI